jgi:hypothetical protein
MLKNKKKFWLAVGFVDIKVLLFLGKIKTNGTHHD